MDFNFINGSNVKINNDVLFFLTFLEFEFDFRGPSEDEFQANNPFIFYLNSQETILFSGRIMSF